MTEIDPPIAPVVDKMETDLAAALSEGLSDHSALAPSELAELHSLAHFLTNEARFELTAVQLVRGESDFAKLVEARVARRSATNRASSEHRGAQNRRRWWWLLAPLPALLAGLFTLQLNRSSPEPVVASTHAPSRELRSNDAPSHDAASGGRSIAALPTPAALVAAQTALLEERLRGEGSQGLEVRLDNELKSYREQLLARLDAP